MQLDEVLLSEKISDTLYHYTSIVPAITILKDGKFELTITTSDENRFKVKNYPYFLSTARTKSGDYFRTVGNIAVTFNLDKNKIKNNYVITPIDYWERMWLSTHGPGKEHRTSETEDRIFSNKSYIPIDNIVTSMHVYVGNYKQNESTSSQVNTLIKLAESRNIPCYIYFNRSAWQTQDIRNSIGKEHYDNYFQGHYTKRELSKDRIQAIDSIQPYLFLISKNLNEYDLLPEKSQRIVDKLRNPGYIPYIENTLKTALANEKKPDSPGRDSAIILTNFMYKNRMSLRGFIEFLNDKWKLH